MYRKNIVYTGLDNILGSRHPLGSWDSPRGEWGATCLFALLAVALAVGCWLVSPGGSPNPCNDRSRFISLTTALLNIKGIIFGLCLIDKVSG